MGIIKRFSLKTQLILVEIGVGLLLITAGIWYRQYDHKSTRTDKYNNLHAIANLKANQLTQWHKERLSEAAFFTTTPPNAEISANIAKGDTTLHSAYKSSLLQIMTNNRYDNIFMLSKNDSVIFSVYPEDKIVSNKTTLHFLNKAFQTKKIQISDFYKCNVHNTIHFDIIAPVFDRKKAEVLASVIFRINPNDYLFPLLQDIPSNSETAETYIVRKEGDSVLYLNNLRHIPNSAMKIKASLNNTNNTAVKAINGYEGFIEAVDYRNVKVLSDIRKVKGTPWYILSEIDSSEAYHEFHQRTILISLLILLTILFVNALFAWFYHFRQKNMYKELYQNKRLLHESQEKLKATLYSIGDGVITTDLDGKIMQLNNVAEKLTGWTEQDAKGKKADEVFKLINEDTLESIQSPVNKVLKEGRIIGLANHTLLVRKNGEHLPIADSGAPIKDEKGNLQGVVMVFSDQSAERHNQKTIKLRLNLIDFAATHNDKEVLQKAIDDICTFMKSPLGFIHFVDDDKQTIQSQIWSSITFEKKCNINSKRAKHYKVEHAGIWADAIRERKPLIHNNYLGKNTSNKLPEEHPALKRELVVPVFRNNKIVAVMGIGNKETEYTNTDISTLKFLADITWTITEVKRKESALKESEERYRLVLDNSIDAILLTNPNGDILTANKAACAMFGMSEEEICNAGRKGIVDPTDKRLKELVKKREEKGSIQAELTFIRKNGEKFPADFSSSIFHTSKGEKRNSLIIRDISERKKTEQLLRDERLLLRTLIDSLPDTIYAKDSLGRKILANKADLEMMGAKSEDEIKGKTDLEVFPTEIGQRGYHEDMDVIKKGKTFINKEDYYNDSKGNKRWRLISKVPIKNEKNQITGLVGFGHDYTSLKETEQQLRENKETLQLLFDSTAEGIYGIDTNGTCTFCNKATLHILGYRDEKELIGKNMHDIAHYKHPDGSLYPEKDCIIYKAFQEGKGTHIDNEVFWRKNGEPFPVEYWSYPIKRNNSVIGSVVTFFDITQRKYNEEVQQILYSIALQSMTAKDVQDLLYTVKNQLNKVIDTTNFYVARYKPGTQTLKKILFVNEKYSIDHWSANNSLSGNVAKSGKTKILNEKEIKQLTREHHKRPEYIPAKSWLGVPLIDQQEVIGVMVVQNYDKPNVFNRSHARLLEMVAHELVIVIQRTRMIEDVIAAKEKAEKSDRLKSAFLANISHEIRTPMNGILGFLDLLNDKDINEKEKSQYLEIMNKSGQRLLETINDIIEISKLESGQVDVNISTVNTDEVMADQYMFFKQQASNKNIELTLESHLEGNKALVKTDKFKLDAILTNILNNAIKYTKTGNIWFGNYLKNNNLIFYVKDTGIGIPPEKMEAIFERFIQDDQYITRPNEGVGLGLSIVKGYIEMLDGKIWVDSAPDKGSTFYVSIPYRK